MANGLLETNVVPGPGTSEIRIPRQQRPFPKFRSRFENLLIDRAARVLWIDKVSCQNGRKPIRFTFAQEKAMPKSTAPRLLLTLLISSLSLLPLARAEETRPAVAATLAEATLGNAPPEAPHAAASSAAAPSGSSLDMTKESESKQRIRRTLESKTELQFPDNSLQEILDYLSQIHSIPIVVEDVAQAEMERSCRLTLAEVSLQSALGLVLKEDLDYVIDDGFLRITTRSAARTRTETRLYNIKEFVDAGMVPDEIVMAATLAMETDKVDFGGIVVLKNLLVVRQNQRSQVRVLEFLEGVRHAMAVQSGEAR